ncbi:MAG: hypothetical protein AAF938_20535 [Myxococcota bacterium]
MKTLWTPIAWTPIALIASLYAGCAAQVADPGDGLVAGEFRVEVVTTFERSSVSGTPHRAGQMFVQADLALFNGYDGGAPINPSTFRLLADDGLEYLASAESALVYGVCPLDALLGAQRSLRCQVLFELPADRRPSEIVYTSALVGSIEPVRASAPVPGFEPCTRCDGECTDLQTDPMNCGACGQAAPRGVPCSAGVAACPDSMIECDGNCVDPLVSVEHCGGCNAGYDGGLCSDGVPTCIAIHTPCGNTCVNLRTDEQHCGACDRPVPRSERASCRDGEIRCGFERAYCDGDCRYLPTDDEHCGACGNACPSRFTCGAFDYRGVCAGTFRLASEDQTCDVRCRQVGAECMRAEYVGDSFRSSVLCEYNRDLDYRRIECACAML